MTFHFFSSRQHGILQYIMNNVTSLYMGQLEGKENSFLQLGLISVLLKISQLTEESACPKSFLITLKTLNVT